MRLVSQGDNPQRLFRYQKMMLTHFRTVKIIPNLSINGRHGCWNHRIVNEPERDNFGVELETRSYSFFFSPKQTSASLFFGSPQWSPFQTQIFVFIVLLSNNRKQCKLFLLLNKLLCCLVISTILIVSLHSFDWKAKQLQKSTQYRCEKQKKSLRVFLMQFIYIAKNLTCTMIIIGYFLSDVVPVCIGQRVSLV